MCRKSASPVCGNACLKTSQVFECRFAVSWLNLCWQTMNRMDPSVSPVDSGGRTDGMCGVIRIFNLVSRNSSVKSERGAVMKVTALKTGRAKTIVVKILRAHGGCLASKRRRRTWKSAKSLEQSITDATTRGCPNGETRQASNACHLRLNA